MLRAARLGKSCTRCAGEVDGGHDMYHSLNSLQEVYMGDYVGEYCRGHLRGILVV